MVIRLLCYADGFLQSQVGLLTEETGSSWKICFSHMHARIKTTHSLVSKVAVQAGQVEGSISQAAAVAVVSVALGVIG